MKSKEISKPVRDQVRYLYLERPDFQPENAPEIVIINGVRYEISKKGKEPIPTRPSSESIQDTQTANRIDKNPE